MLWRPRTFFAAVAAPIAVLVLLASGPTVASSLVPCTGVAIAVRVYGDSASGVFFPAVALPVALYSLSATQGNEQLASALSDMYGLVRLCVRSLGDACDRSHRPTSLPSRLVDNSMSSRTGVSDGRSSVSECVVLSVNELPLPHHRPDWSASRLQCCGGLKCSWWALGERSVAVRLLSLDPSTYSATAAAVELEICAAAVARSTASRVLALCCHMADSWLVLASCTVVLTPMLLLLWRRAWPAPLLPSRPRAAHRLTAVLPSVSLRINAGQPHTGSSEASTSALDLCCRCHVCTAAPRASIM